jgi:hypothetical protein
MSGSKELYVQFLARERCYSCEICSHRFVPEMEPRLTDAAVETLEACGFRWPGAKQNFARRLPVQGRDDCVRLADLAFGALHALCGLSPGAAFETKVVIPRTPISSAVRAAVAVARVNGAT